MLNPIGPAAATQGAPSSGLGQLGSDAFLKLLVAQLKYQNPMNPGDGTAMLEQTAQFTTVETLQNIAEMNQRLMGFQQVTMALGVVGKPITALSYDGRYVEGVVESLRFTPEGPLLSLDTGLEVPLDNVMTVESADPPADDVAPPPVVPVATPEEPATDG